jgi:aspartate/methionine/tyrosine aminotransferase
VLPLNGSREGLFFATLPAVGRKDFGDRRPVMLLPNPFYQAYLGGTYGTGCEPFYLNATAETGHLPDLDTLAREPDVLRRAAAFFLCTPANPQGSVAGPEYLRKALALAREYDFMLFLDECYSEIYTREAPTGGLQVAAATPERFKNVIVFNSLSKRSNLPGMRSGFACRRRRFPRHAGRDPQPHGPANAGARAARFRRRLVGGAARLRHPPGLSRQVQCVRRAAHRPLRLSPAGRGFFLWLDMSQLGGGEEATLTIWKRCGVKVIPGVYLAHEDRHGVNPGRDFIRVALVHDAATVREALTRIVKLTA